MRTTQNFIKDGILDVYVHKKAEVISRFNETKFVIQIQQHFCENMKELQFSAILSSTLRSIQNLYDRGAVKFQSWCRSFFMTFEEVRRFLGYYIDDTM